MARSRNPRKSRSIQTPKGTQVHVKDRRKSQLKGPDRPLKGSLPKSGVISEELAEEITALARELGIPPSELKIPISMLGGRRKRNKFKKALEEGGGWHAW